MKQSYWKAALEEVNRKPEPDQARIEKRLAMCGHSWIRYFDPATGLYKASLYTCDIWRNKLCPRCFRARMDFLCGRALRAVVEMRNIDGANILTVRANLSLSRSLTRRLSREEYIRYPVSESEDLFFVRSDATGIKPSDGMKVVTYDEVQEMDWEEIALTPRGRISGGLGVSKPEPQEYQVKMETLVLDSETTEEQQKTALIAAYEATIGSDPQTVEEVEKAVKERTGAYEKALREAGGKIFSRRTVTRHFSRIAWEQYEKNDIERFMVTRQSDTEIPF